MTEPATKRTSGDTGSSWTGNMTAALVGGLIAAVAGVVLYTVGVNLGLFPSFLLPQPRLTVTMTEVPGYGDDRLFAVELHNAGQAQATLRQIEIAVEDTWDMNAIIDRRGVFLPLTLPALPATYTFNLPATPGITVTQDLGPSYPTIDPQANDTFQVLLQGVPPVGAQVKRDGMPYVEAYEIKPTFVYESVSSGAEEWIAQEEAVPAYGEAEGQCASLDTLGFNPLSMPLNALTAPAPGAPTPQLGDFMSRMYNGTCSGPTLR